MTKMTKYEQYLICKEQGHKLNWSKAPLFSEPRITCSLCDTICHFEKQPQLLVEENVPTPEEKLTLAEKIKRAAKKLDELRDLWPEYFAGIYNPLPEKHKKKAAQKLRIKAEKEAMWGHEEPEKPVFPEESKKKCPKCEKIHDEPTTLCEICRPDVPPSPQGHEVEQTRKGWQNGGHIPSDIFVAEKHIYTLLKEIDKLKKDMVTGVVNGAGFVYSKDMKIERLEKEIDRLNGQLKITRR